MSKLPASTGWAWLKQGAALFRKQPGGLTTLMFANILISIAFSAVPVVGPILAVVLIPSLSMAFMQACLMIDNGQRVTPGVLLTGFRKPAVVTLCKLGLVYLAVSLLLALLARFAIDQSFWEQITVQQPDPKKLAVDVSDVLAMFLIFVLDLAALISLAFAAPLTYWEKMGPGKATFYSFFAVVKSARVFSVLLLAWFGLFFSVCMLVALVVGPVHIAQVIIMWLIFLFVLLLQCAIYVGYRQIFGKPVQPQGQPA
ncbi:BPSS1780 family membrane protein [Massilia solisilvae]|uniref:BPSS1780 family membrane protein n=1 Tax=Massilia solisilvae TaxID=1811225 RepID=A0ABT2BPS9_9BURK|nr:BPSS1780 family membrane protein [Massilia solisilvae]MCS0610517.1 BPSS1780 family membrane protein [Massilia solisilvae]